MPGAYTGLRRPEPDIGLPLTSGRSSPQVHSFRSAATHSSPEREAALNSLNGYKRMGSPIRTGSEGHDGKDFQREDDGQSQGVPSTNKKRQKKRRAPVTVNLSNTRYEVVRHMAEECGFTMSREDDQNSYLLWNDSFVSTEKISELKPYQRINHFPGMGEVCRKDCLARNMAKMAKEHPDEYNFVPRTWIFPSEYNAFQNYARELKKKKKTKTFIVKPANGAMGNGIQLFRNAEKIPQNDHLIVQEYLDKPFLVDGYKCDLRIYVLMTSCDPLRVFLYHDGLLRMSTEKYIHPTEGNLDKLFMHLTNYSVNKHNEHYEKSGTIDTGSKRSLRFLNEYLRRNDYDVAYLWRSITDVIIKTLLVAEPHVLHAYRMCRPGQATGSDSVCFEVLGFDIMLDKKLRPWLLEINRSPSFGTDEKLDYDIKSGVIRNTIKLLNIRASDKRKNLAAQKAQAQRRLLRPAKRIDGDITDIEKKRMTVERKKEELKELLSRMRRDSAREDYENRNCGNFKRIFPPDDKFRREKFSSLMADAFSTLMAGRAQSLQSEIQRTYNSTLREEDVLDMLAQCEADERDGKIMATSRPHKGPRPLASMPSSRDLEEDLEIEDDELTEEEGSPRGSPSSGWSSKGRPESGTRSRSGYRSSTSAGVSGQRSRSLSRSGTNGRHRMLLKSALDDSLMGMQGKEWEEELTRRTLMSLNDMHIKFPGKTDEEADYILDKLHENWKFHKPRIASYWLVKLDSIKRRKVIDIVRSNVRAVLQRTWRTSDVDSLKLYRIFSRVFNRLLWSHGQGLWNCFSSQGNSWETIFSKSTDVVTSSELNCCRRIVQLCRDCLLIVYQFASDAKNGSSSTAQHESDYSARPERVSSGHESSSTRPNNPWNPSQSISQRISRLYQGRADSINSLHSYHGPS